MAGLPEMLYHYTNGSGLLGIAKSTSLWASCIRYMNDSTEFLYSIELARKLLKKREPALSRTELDFFDFLLGNHFERWPERPKLPGVAYFSASLIPEPDLLSQWRAYGGDIGYNIGWRTEDLLRICDKQRCELKQCVYDVADQEALLVPCLEAALRLWNEKNLAVDFGANYWEDGEIREELMKMRLAFNKEFEKLATTFKSPVFIQENEFRIIKRGSLDDRGHVAGFSERQFGPDFRVGKTFLVPFVKIYFSSAITEFERAVGGEIWVGPHPEPDLAMTAVKGLFRGWGQWGAMRVRASAAPYRAT